MKADNVSALLRTAGVSHEVYWVAGQHTVYVSDANQLYAQKRTFDCHAFRKAFHAYNGWEAHHVVEAQDLARLGIANRFPVYEEQLTVLLPAGGHRGRINARLRVTAPIGLVKVTASVLLSAYEDAYSILGNYSGASEGAIKKELMNIVSVCIGR